MKPYSKWNPPVRYAAFAVVLIIAGIGLWYVRSVLEPLVIAAFIAYLINPGVNFLTRRTRLSRKAAVNLVFSVTLIIIIGTLLGIAVIRELLGFGTLLGVKVTPARWDNWGVIAMAQGAWFVVAIFYWVFRRAAQLNEGALIFAYAVRDPERYGVVEFDEHKKVISLEEKPKQPKSHYAVPGIYFYDSQVVDFVSRMKPSRRDELEITDLNRIYLERGQLSVETIGRGVAWLDAGTHESLLQSAGFVQAVQERQGMMISCPEEIAYRMGYINVARLREFASSMADNGYASYLKRLADEADALLPYGGGGVAFPLPERPCEGGLIAVTHQSGNAFDADVRGREVAQGGLQADVEANRVELQSALRNASSQCPNAHAKGRCNRLRAVRAPEMGQQGVAQADHKSRLFIRVNDGLARCGGAGCRIPESARIEPHLGDVVVRIEFGL